MTVHVCGSHRITIEKILASSERAQNVLAVWTNNACKHRNESLPPSTWLTCPSYRIQIGMSVTHFQRIVLCTHTWHVSVYAIAQRPSSYATVHTTLVVFAQDTETITKITWFVDTKMLESPNFLHFFFSKPR